jgi:hypothetical protein
MTSRATVFVARTDKEKTTMDNDDDDADKIATAERRIGRPFTPDELQALGSPVKDDELDLLVEAILHEDEDKDEDKDKDKDDERDET